MPFNSKKGRKIAISTNNNSPSGLQKILNFDEGFGVSISTTEEADHLTVRISSTIQQYTDEMAQDAIASTLVDTSTVDWTYNDSSNLFTASVIPAGINHQDLTGAGTNTHAQIDSHINNTSNPHSTTKAQLGLGSVENTALSTWPGTTNITTLGTISSGSVPFSLVTGTVPVNRGGTGLTSAPSNGQLLIGNGTDFTLANLTAGDNCTIVNSAGGIQIVGVPAGGPLSNIWAWAKDDGGLPTTAPVVSGSSNAIAIGNACTVTGTSFGSFSVGYNNTVQTGSIYSGIFGGKDNVITGADYATIAGGQGNTVNGDYGAIFGGHTNITGKDSYIVGGSSNSINQDASGSYNNIILGGTNNTIASTSQYCTIAAGDSNTVNSSNYCFVAGKNNQVLLGSPGNVSEYNFCSGQSNVVRGFRNFVSGYGIETKSILSNTIGFSDTLDLGAYTRPLCDKSINICAHAAETLDWRGQVHIIPLRILTSLTATPAIMTTDGLAPSYTNVMRPFAPNSVYTFEGYVNAKESGGSNFAAAFKVEGTLKADSSGVFTVLHSAVTVLYRDDVNYNVTIGVGTTSGISPTGSQLEIKAVGVASDVIRWSGQLTVVSVEGA